MTKECGKSETRKGEGCGRVRVGEGRGGGEEGRGVLK